MNNKRISYLFAFSGILLFVAFITISYSFSYKQPIIMAKEWDVYFSEPFTEGESGRTIISNDKMDINVSLKKCGDTYKIYSSVNNDGDIDAFLSRLDTTDLYTFKVGKGKSGKTYYLGDYIDVSIKYGANNKDNNITKGETLTIGDSLNHGTVNNIIITFRYKELSELTDEQIKVLKENVKLVNGYYKLNFGYSINVNYIGK